ncbi:3999_t:CDS:2 [Ambispora leptoticha]|uniref:3999_t:CDS:1 n=1 Tax=Ambispora leptoticha TaxID=144679 RepID=A0A9N8ZPV3_9GLOM|nr:3999_t:CDS:2 [Ambispora leptoticha]
MTSARCVNIDETPYSRKANFLLVTFRLVVMAFWFLLIGGDDS